MEILKDVHVQEWVSRAARPVRWYHPRGDVNVRLRNPGYFLQTTYPPYFSPIIDHVLAGSWRLITGAHKAEEPPCHQTVLA